MKTSSSPRILAVLVLGLFAIVPFRHARAGSFPKEISNAELQQTTFTFQNTGGASSAQVWHAPAWMIPAGFNSIEWLNEPPLPVGRELNPYDERKALYREFLNHLVVEYLREQSYNDIETRLSALGADMSEGTQLGSDIVDSVDFGGTFGIVVEGLGELDDLMRVNSNQLLTESGRAASVGNWQASASALSTADTMQAVRKITKPIKQSGAGEILGGIALGLEGLTATIETLDYANEALVYVFYNAMVAEETLLYLNTILNSPDRGLSISDEAWVDALDELIAEIEMIKDANFIKRLLTGFSNNFDDLLELRSTWGGSPSR